MKKLIFLLLALAMLVTADEIKSELYKQSYQLTESQKQIKELENKVENLTLELNKHTQIQENTKDRIGDISFYISLFGITTALFGVLITGIIIFFTIRSTKEAKQAAKEELQEWIDKKADEEFAKKVQPKIKEIEDKGIEVLEKIRLKAEDQLTKQQNDFLAFKDIYSEQEKRDINEQVKESESKAEKDKTFDDFWFEILAKYTSKEYHEVLILIDKALNLELNEEQLSNILFAKGVTLSKLGESLKVVEVYDELIERFKDSTIDNVQVHVASAMRNKGVTYGEIGKSLEEIEVYDELIEKFKDSTIDKVQVEVASAMRNKGVTYSHVGESLKAVEVYDELIERFKNSTIDEIQVEVASAMRNKGVTYSHLGESLKAVEVYDELIEKFKDSTIDKVQVEVASAMRNKGVRLGSLSENLKEIEVYDELIERFKNSTIDEIQVEVASAMKNKGVTYSEIGKSLEEIEVYDELIEKFKDSTIDEIQIQVASAMKNKGVIYSDLGESQKVIEVYDEFISRFKDSKIDKIQADLVKIINYMDNSIN